LRTGDRTIVRAGAELFPDASGHDPIGVVTSGGFGPSANAAIAMGYLPLSYAVPNTSVFAQVRGRRIPVSVVPLPFVPHRYKR
jgi:aminomethyltransferase